ncbi:MAG TPA: S8 family serine peptidase [Gaiellaceae bacterium]|nr:S8 family serine peptidase [Gaiellaceae bacterium]
MKLLIAVMTVALAFPGAAQAVRFAVGVAPGTDASALARTLEARTGGSTSTIGPFAVALEAPSARGMAALRGVTYVERLTASRRVAFVPTDPFFSRQWYIPAVRAFEAWPFRPAWLRDVKVAIIDSGIDRYHPEFRDRIAAANTFVGGSAFSDKHGHGTFVAGLIAARLDTEGIAGMAFPAKLLVAKVVRSDGVVPLEAEARAIRWAADRGARVINLSLGGMRDPFDPNHDSYSPLEASAVEYAVRKGAVVVAAVGNGDQAREQPWKYASYPAALPHVLGVSALDRDGSVPMFSNRDDVYNDVAAPGEDLFSTLPRSLTALRPTCLEQGYSECGPPDFRRAQGTSFASAIVSAGAVLVRSTWPNLKADQIVAMMEQSAVDQTLATGCRRCTAERDALTGWGKLDVAAAVNWKGNLPLGDQFEPNDDAGARAARIKRRHSVKRRATIDFWNDQNDVYSVQLRKGERFRVALWGKATIEVNLVLWMPGTRRLDDIRSLTGRQAVTSENAGSREKVSYVAERSGRYYVHVKIAKPGADTYTLQLVRE